MKKLLLTIIALSMITYVNAQITLGQINDFEDGTTQGWVNGAASPNPPTNIPTGGPNGVDDNFLEEISAGGSGPGSRLVVFNDEDEWTGNYTAASVEFIVFDAKNAGSTNLSLRIAIEGGDDTTEMVTTQFISLPASQSSWTEIAINVETASFTIVDGSNTVAEILADVSDIRIISNPNISYMGEAIVGTLHVDNIRTDALLGGIDENDFSKNLKVFPNPVKDRLNISSTYNLESYSLFSVTGKLILDASDVENLNQIDFSGFASGMYLLKVRSGDKEIIKKIVKR